MSPETFEPKDRFDIQVALKIIRHISSGIYRDRAGSVKELISNSFDAQATKVTIDTGYPKHDTIVIQDNGFGMDASTLRKAFTQVGLSLKVTNPGLYEGEIKRPMIGRFGIGFLAAAHISKDIWITSFRKGETQGLQAHIDLNPYFLYMNSIETFDQFKFGTVEYGEVPAPKDVTSGTTVELRNVQGGYFHTTLTRDGIRLVRWPPRGFQEKKPGSSMKQFVERSQRRVNLLYLDRLQGREEILWHLGMATPVRYLDGGPIRPGHAEGEAKKVVDRIVEYNEGLRFEVWMDGVEVRKPILLPTHRTASGEDEVADLPTEILVSPVKIDGKPERGGRVRAEGYLFYQPWRIVPAELRGLYPRANGVGVGTTYENRFLSYLKAENPILRVQISGELYIHEGLSEALNLDRSGFMELDPEYQYLATEAGGQVQEFFRKAKTTRAHRRTTVKARQAATERDRAVSSLKNHLKRLGIKADVELQPDIDTTQIESDYSQIAIYPIGLGVDILINRGAKTVVLTTTDPDEINMGKVALIVDWVLGKFSKEAPAARREFANQLRVVIDEEGSD